MKASRFYPHLLKYFSILFYLISFDLIEYPLLDFVNCFLIKSYLHHSKFFSYWFSWVGSFLFIDMGFIFGLAQEDFLDFSSALFLVIYFNLFFFLDCNNSKSLLIGFNEESLHIMNSYYHPESSIFFFWLNSYLIHLLDLWFYCYLNFALFLN